MSENTSPGKVILGWWSVCIAAENGAARKARAELRRAASPADVLAHEVAHDLNTRLNKANDAWNLRNRPETLALIAATLAGVEDSIKMALPRKFGMQAGERRALSDLRFQRIIRTRDPWTLAVLLRRALPLVAKSCNAAGLGDDLFWWGDKVRNRWCFEYFGSSPPAQLADAATPENLESEDA